ncbi:universal stress protein [Herbaspirillum sp. GCM10030257]|uniref:universal stress protein n=1 Tax=Herbaspirillum sp. GCM10030257 TaxID=3273393 RepID=UPI00361BDA7C
MLNDGVFFGSGKIMFRSILVPVDGSRLSNKPVQAAIEIAKMHGATLVFLSVAEPRLFTTSDLDKVDDGRAAEDLNLEAARANVQKAVNTSKEAHVPCEAVIRMSRIPCEEILETAARFQCELIIMATRGKMGIADTVFKESTTQQLLKKAEIPVLVFPQSSEVH